MKEKIKLAILDMNNAEPNQGLRCISQIVSSFKDKIDYQIFDVRAKNELPDLSFDIFISSGGPGSPLEDGKWRQPYLNFMQQLWDFNKNSSDEKKHVFLICYSFQVMCHHFELGSIKPRKSTSFGVLPVHKTKMGLQDLLLEGLNDPFYAVDSEITVRPYYALKRYAHMLSMKEQLWLFAFQKNLLELNFTLKRIPWA
jgi:homoserine O-succinyltransferase